MMQVERISEYNSFLKMESYWDDLLHKSAYNLVFLTFDLIKTEWEHLGWEIAKEVILEPFILLVRENDEIVAIFPFVKGKMSFYGFPITYIRPLTNIYTDRFDVIFIKKPLEVFKRVIDYFKTEETGWNLLTFNNIEESSYLIKYASSTSDFKIGIMNGHRSPYVDTNIDWRDYIESRSKNCHKQLRNKLNRIERGGDKIIAREYHGPEEVKCALDIAFDIDMKSWKAKNGTGISSTSKTKNYWHTLTRHLSQKNRVGIWLLWLNDKAIAFDYHVIYDKKIYSLKCSYDEAYQRYSPGFLLTYEILKSIWSTGIREVDLLGSTDLAKEVWTAKKRQHYNIYIFNNNFYPNLIHYIVFRIRVLLLKWIR